MYNVHCKMCYFLWYILLATAFIFVLDATKGLQHGIMLQILLSFTLIFHLWQPWHAEFEKFMLFLYFSIFGFMCVHSQPTKIMFVDTKYKNGKQILY